MVKSITVSATVSDARFSKVHWVIIWEGRKISRKSGNLPNMVKLASEVTFKARLYRSWPVFIFIRKESHELFKNYFI